MPVPDVEDTYRMINYKFIIFIILKEGSLGNMKTLNL